MHIVRGRAAGSRSEHRGDTFTGEVWADTLLPRTENVMLNNVFFAPGARTHWHRHEAGQVLHVLAGEGRVFDRDGKGDVIRTGDVVFIPAGEEHWHGAGPASYMLHLAVSIGATEWLDPVTDEQYESTE